MRFIDLIKKYGEHYTINISGNKNNPLGSYCFGQKCRECKVKTECFNLKNYDITPEEIQAFKDEYPELFI